MLRYKVFMCGLQYGYVLNTRLFVFKIVSPLFTFKYKQAGRVKMCRRMLGTFSSFSMLLLTINLAESFPET